MPPALLTVELVLLPETVEVMTKSTDRQVRMAPPLDEDKLPTTEQSVIVV